MRQLQQRNVVTLLTRQLSYSDFFAQKTNDIKNIGYNGTQRDNCA